MTHSHYSMTHSQEHLARPQCLYTERCKTECGEVPGYEKIYGRGGVALEKNR
jgi:hypothetical protein